MMVSSQLSLEKEKEEKKKKRKKPLNTFSIVT